MASRRAPDVQHPAQDHGDHRGRIVLQSQRAEPEVERLGHAELGHAHQAKLTLGARGGARQRQMRRATRRSRDLREHAWPAAGSTADSAAEIADPRQLRGRSRSAPAWPAGSRPRPPRWPRTPPGWPRCCPAGIPAASPSTSADAPGRTAPSAPAPGPAAPATVGASTPPATGGGGRSSGIRTASPGSAARNSSVAIRRARSRSVEQRPPMQPSLAAGRGRPTGSGRRIDLGRACHVRRPGRG